MSETEDNLAFNEYEAKIIANHDICDDEGLMSLLLDVEFRYIGHRFVLRLAQTTIGLGYQHFKQNRCGWLVVWQHSQSEGELLGSAKPKIAGRIIRLVEDYLANLDD